MDREPEPLAPRGSPRQGRRLGQRLALVAMALALVAGAAGVVAYLRTGSAPTPPLSPVTTPATVPNLLPPNPDLAVAGTPASAPAASRPVRLLVPTAKIDLRIIEGDGVTVPLNLAMHYPGTPEPGQPGNAVLYGHAQPGMFLGLYDVHLGDGVSVDVGGGRSVTYQVRAIRRVPWNDVSVLKPTPYTALTLVTCTSYNPYDNRLVVTATEP